MDIEQSSAANRILVVDDEASIIAEYVHCLGSGFNEELASTTLHDLEKVLFGDDPGDKDTERFDVQTCNQAEAAIESVQRAIDEGRPYSIVFLDIRMPPGMDGIAAGRRIRDIDPNVNIVIVSGSLSAEQQNLGAEIPPSDRVFFFRKPFHAIECRQLAAALCGKWHADLSLRQANDVLEHRVEERTRALHRLAYFDPVTNLPNRLNLVEELQLMIERAESERDEVAAVLLDIERFSFLNETLGHQAGTELLGAIGSRLVEQVAAMSTKSNGLVGRFGADEFACLLTGVRDKAELDRYVAKIHQCVERPFLVGGRNVYLKVSVGVAWHPLHGRDGHSVFRCAESALHRSRRNRLGRVTFYHEDMQHRAQHKFDMEAELRQAIDSGQIVAWFQPQLCLASGEIRGIEALARWVRPDGTIVPPADFVPLSEEIGLSDLLFQSVMRHVCGVIAGWPDGANWPVPVSINLSAHQLRNRDLADLVQQLLREQDVAHQLINLELTETALLEDLDTSRSILADLATVGIDIHVDDFGTGYSSLSYLAELPVQVLKIDQSFVRRLTDSESNTRVVQAIIALGKAMDLHVIAEGIETEQQLSLVTDLGCDLAQGYLIARPMPGPDLIKWRDSVDQADIRSRLPDMGTRSA